MADGDGRDSPILKEERSPSRSRSFREKMQEAKKTSPQSLYGVKMTALSAVPASMPTVLQSPPTPTASGQAVASLEAEDDAQLAPFVQYPDKAPDFLWYKEAVFYEVYVRAFCDGNGDGIGDLIGLTSKLDYLHNLGVTCLWLLPIYPSPLKDDGYDVANYCDVHPQLGTLQDFKVLVEAIHERNMKIIVDFVPNHTSDQHEWFQKSRSAQGDPNSPYQRYKDYYVWSDTPDRYHGVRIIFCDTEESNWTWDPVAKKYYWHRFFRSQPDLNFDNPLVQEEMLNVVKFWLDLGVDGFRADAVPYLFEREGTSCENVPETHAFLKRMRKFIDDNYPSPPRMLLSEANMWPHDVIQYFGNGDEFHMAFNFPVMPRLFMALRKGDKTSIVDIMNATPKIPPNCQWCIFLRNHDELTLEMVTEEDRQWMWAEYAPEHRMRINLGIRRRLAPLLDNDRRRIELLHSLLFTLPGSPILYYGDELGMGDNILLFDRNGVRTPMQWDSGPCAGFSYSTTAKLFNPVIQEQLYAPDRVNVNQAMKDSASLYSIIKRLISVRKQHPSFGWGTLEWVETGKKEVLAYVRRHPDTDEPVDCVLCVHNLSDAVQDVTIQIPCAELGLDPDTNYCVEMLTRMRVPVTSYICEGTACNHNHNHQQQSQQQQQQQEQQQEHKEEKPTENIEEEELSFSPSNATQGGIAPSVMESLRRFSLEPESGTTTTTSTSSISSNGPASSGPQEDAMVNSSSPSARTTIATTYKSQTTSTAGATAGMVAREKPNITIIGGSEEDVEMRAADRAGGVGVGGVGVGELEPLEESVASDKLRTEVMTHRNIVCWNMPLTLDPYQFMWINLNVYGRRGY